MTSPSDKRYSASLKPRITSQGFSQPASLERISGLEAKTKFRLDLWKDARTEGFSWISKGQERGIERILSS